MSAMIPILPESAPFSVAQRAWLNGFFAGLMNGAGAGAANGPLPEAAAAVAAAPPAPVEESFPWHDPALPMDERLKLAEGKPRARLLMAAMAQLDCGSCGYDCKTYAEAIDRGEDKDLSKCSPGGAETAKKLKELVKLTVTAATPAAPAAKAPAPAVAHRPAAPAAPAGKWSRDHPYPARLVANRPLNASGSAKDTRHVVFSIKDSGLTYEAGDALGVCPENCAETVGRILDLLGATGAEDVPGRASPHETISLFEALSRHYSVTRPTPALLDALADAATPTERDSIRALAQSDAIETQGWEILDLLERFPSARPNPRDFVGTLSSLRPRLYSISSSPKAHAGEVHLTVGVVRYTNGAGRACKGVASTCIADRVRVGERMPVFVQRSHFRLPADGDAPIIMVGPGTGVAPFRAFLHERRAVGARGRNWLIFGDQHEATDFLYRDELEELRRDGALTRLDTAFSRDGAEKVYVQHRMREHAAELYGWLKDGASFYVCGDAKRMARDVDAALRRIVAEQGGMSSDAADEFVAELTKSKRYLRDVY